MTLAEPTGTNHKQYHKHHKGKHQKTNSLGSIATLSDKIFETGLIQRGRSCYDTTSWADWTKHR